VGQAQLNCGKRNVSKRNSKQYSPNFNSLKTTLFGRSHNITLPSTIAKALCLNIACTPTNFACQGKHFLFVGPKAKQHNQ